MDTSADSWRRNITQLYESFQRTNEELNLLRTIDRAIVAQLDGSTEGGGNSDEHPKSIEEVFLDSFGRLARNYKLKPGRCYVYVGDELLPLMAAGESGVEPPLHTPEIVRRFSEKRHEDPVVVARDHEHEDLFEQVGSDNTALIQPIYEGERLFAVLLFSDSEVLVGSALDDPDLRMSVSTVARQLSIAYTHYVRAEQEKRAQELWNLFIADNLAPTSCFKRLALMAQSACPDFGPLKLEKEPEVQILVLERDLDERPLFLTIRGTTGEEPANTKIQIGGSISGLLVEDEPYDREFFCDDPRKDEYRGIYKSYLGEEAGAEIKTELAVRLTSPSGDLVGVLNLESGLKNAFNLRHRLAILEFAERISRMVEVFEERIDHNRVMQLSVSSVTSKYLDSLAGIFRHGVASPLLAFQGDVEGARIILDEEIQPLLEESEANREDASNGSNAALANGFAKLSEAINALGVEYRQVYEFTNDFGTEISGFGDTGRFDLRQLIDETVSLAQRSYLVKAEKKIAIVVDGTNPAFAFCSRLFKQHFFSLLTNAIHSLQESSAKGPEGRRIEVTIEPHVDADDSQEVELNQSWLVRVRDNGDGVGEEELRGLEAFKPGTRYRLGAPGQGLGLVAMQRYMGSIGGWLELDSVEGEFFEVSLLFDKYSEDIHGPLSILSGGGSASGS